MLFSSRLRENLSFSPNAMHFFISQDCRRLSDRTKATKLGRLLYSVRFEINDDSALFSSQHFLPPPNLACKSSWLVQALSHPPIHSSHRTDSSRFARSEFNRNPSKFQATMSTSESKQAAPLTELTEYVTDERPQAAAPPRRTQARTVDT